MRHAGSHHRLAIAALLALTLMITRNRMDSRAPEEQQPDNCQTLSQRFSQEARVVSGNYALNNRDWPCAAAFFQDAATAEPGDMYLERKAMIATLNIGNEEQAFSHAMLQMGQGDHDRELAMVMLAAKTAHEAENADQLALMWDLLGRITGQVIYDELRTSPNLQPGGDNATPYHVAVAKELAGILHRRGNFLRGNDGIDGPVGLFMIRCALVADPRNRVATALVKEIGEQRTGEKLTLQPFPP